MSKFGVARVASFVPFVVLVFGVTVSHLLLAATAMPYMSSHLQPSQCQSACMAPASQEVSVIASNATLEDTGISTSGLYYLIFLVCGWLIVFAAAFMQSYLHWRPPNIHKLNMVYRI